MKALSLKLTELADPWVCRMSRVLALRVEEMEFKKLLLWIMKLAMLCSSWITWKTSIFCPSQMLSCNRIQQSFRRHLPVKKVTRPVNPVPNKSRNNKINQLRRVTTMAQVSSRELRIITTISEISSNLEVVPAKNMEPWKKTQMNNWKIPWKNNLISSRELSRKMLLERKKLKPQLQMTIRRPSQHLMDSSIAFLVLP